MFALLPPSPENLAIFAAWASSARRLPVFLAEHAHGALKAEVPAGATLFIPGAESPQTRISLSLVALLMMVCCKHVALLRSTSI